VGIDTPNYEKRGGTDENIVSVETAQAFHLKFVTKRNQSAYNGSSKCQHTTTNY